jgi:hypothetical protein
MSEDATSIEGTLSFEVAPKKLRAIKEKLKEESIKNKIEIIT